MDFTTIGVGGTQLVEVQKVAGKLKKEKYGIWNKTKPKPKNNMPSHYGKHDRKKQLLCMVIKTSHSR